MNIITTKQILDIGQNIIILSFSLWMLEKLVFLVYEGWHWKAVSALEEILNEMCAFGIDLGILIIEIAIFVYVIDAIKKENKS